MRSRGTLSAVMAGALSLVMVVPVLGADILVYGPSDGIESNVATNGGHSVTVADEAAWTAMTTAEFGTFDAIVIGDAGCTADPTPLGAAIANRTTWSPAVDGGITVSNFDPGAHDGEGKQSVELTLNSINFAAAGPGTGLYFTTGCYYETGTPTVLTILDQFGAFTVDGFGGDFITIVDGTHPVMTGLTAEGLSNWSASVHSHFTAFPATFEVLATEGGEIIIEGGEGGVLGAEVPIPVILARAGATPTPTPSPTGTAAPTGTPAASLLPNTTVAGSSSESVAGLAALVLLLFSGALYGAIELRRRGVIARR